MPQIDILFLFRSEPGRLTWSTASEIAAKFKTSVKTIERKARPISIRKAAVRKSSRSGRPLPPDLRLSFDLLPKSDAGWGMFAVGALAAGIFIVIYVSRAQKSQGELGK